MKKALFFQKLIQVLKRMKILKLFFLFFFFCGFYLRYKIKNALVIKGKFELKWNQLMIFIVNHACVEDVELVLGVAASRGKLVHILISEKDFKKPEYNIVFKALGMIPRMGTGSNVVNMMTRVIEKGHILVLTPEGTRSRGLVTHGFTGLIRVYFNVNKNGYEVPILPCFIEGAGQTYPTENSYFLKMKHPQGNKIRIHVGKPFYLKIPEKIDKITLRKYSDYVMLKLARMGGKKRLYPNAKLSNFHNQGKFIRKYEEINGLNGIEENF